MPISTHISLVPQTDVTLRPTMGHHAHAAFLAILRESDPDLTETLHAQSAQKPFTVSPLVAKAKAVTPNNSISGQAPIANSDSRSLRMPSLQPSGAPS